MLLVDTHAHLNDPLFDEPVDPIIDRARSAGVQHILVCGYDLPSSRLAVDMAAERRDLSATVGLQPHRAQLYCGETEEQFRSLCRNECVVAVGEIGLDYHYDNSPRQQQLGAFEAQLRLASDLGLPVVVHSREAMNKTLDVLCSLCAFVPRGVMHCFSGSLDDMRKCLDLGYYVGVDGPLTYKNARRLREVVEFCPHDRLLLETDSPYLSPTGHRGQRNEPSFLPIIAREVAQVWRVGLSEVAYNTTCNARTLFGSRIPCPEG